MTGTSCKLYWDNGGPELAALRAAGGARLERQQLQTARSVDNFVTKPCLGHRGLRDRGYVWNNCVPPTAFIEVYEDSPCSLNYDFDRRCPSASAPTDPIFPRPKAERRVERHADEQDRRHRRRHHHGYPLFTSLKLTLQPGRSYWIQHGVNGTGSFARAPTPTTAPIPRATSRSAPASPGARNAPRRPWVEGYNFAFRIFVSTPAEEVARTRDSTRSNCRPGAADLDHDGDSDVTDLFGFPSTSGSQAARKNAGDNSVLITRARPEAGSRSLSLGWSTDRLAAARSNGAMNARRKAPPAVGGAHSKAAVSSNRRRLSPTDLQSAPLEPLWYAAVVLPQPGGMTRTDAKPVLNGVKPPLNASETSLGLAKPLRFQPRPTSGPSRWNNRDKPSRTRCGLCHPRQKTSTQAR